MRWRYPNIEKPPSDQRLLFSFKHGIIDGFFDLERFEKEGVFVGSTYIWYEFEFYIEKWMPLSEFQSAIEKEKDEVEG